MISNRLNLNVKLLIALAGLVIFTRTSSQNLQHIHIFPVRCASRWLLSLIYKRSAVRIQTGDWIEIQLRSSTIPDYRPVVPLRNFSPTSDVRPSTSNCHYTDQQVRNDTFTKYVQRTVRIRWKQKIKQSCNINGNLMCHATFEWWFLKAGETRQNWREKKSFFLYFRGSFE